MDCRMKFWWVLMAAIAVVNVMVIVLVTTRAPVKGDRKSGCEEFREVRLPTSYDSTPFGYSKNFFIPKYSTFLRSEQYIEPSNLPPSTTWACGCYVENSSALCPHKLDHGIPACVDSSVAAVFINSSEVDRLPVDTFRHLPQLQYIEILYTKIQLLGNNLFHGTPDLKHLLVFVNEKLSYLERDVFRGASNLEYVIVGYSNISSLERDVFTHLKNLKKLDLASNKIRSLPEGIFRDNLELQELDLSKNPLHISSDVARGLLRNNAKLRVLEMYGCGLKELPPGLLSNASSLEWLDLSDNNISTFPSESIQDCTKLAYLNLALNALEVLTSDLPLQHGGSLASLYLWGNPLHCDCNLLALASWATLRIVGLPWAAKCRSPPHVEGKSLKDWFLSIGAEECGGAASALRTDLSRVLSACRAIAGEGPDSFAVEELGFAAANYFLVAMSVRTGADVVSVVGRWARLLEDVVGRQDLRHDEAPPRTAVDATATTEPPAAAATKRRKGFEPLVNFTYVMMNIPENMTKEVDDGIKEELKILFRYINGTNATRQKTAECDGRGQRLTGTIEATKSSKGALAPPKKLSATEEVVYGLRSELRELLFTLLKSIDQAKKDALRHHSINNYEDKDEANEDRLT